MISELKRLLSNSHSPYDEKCFASIVVMKDGKIVADDLPQKVFSDIGTIKSAGLSIPQTTDLLSKLADCGFDVDKSLIYASDCAEEIIKLINGKSESFSFLEE